MERLRRDRPFWRLTHQATEYDELNAYLSCFDGIAIGCAAVLDRHLRLPAGFLSPLQGIAALATTGFYLTAPVGETAVYGVTLMALGTAAVLIGQDGMRPGVRPAAITGPIRRCGRLSYELYLFHLVVLGLLRTVWPPEATAGDAKLALLAAYLVLSAALAVLVGRHCSDPLNAYLRGRASPVTMPARI